MKRTVRLCWLIMKQKRTSTTGNAIIIKTWIKNHNYVPQNGFHLHYVFHKRNKNFLFSDKNNEQNRVSALSWTLALNTFDGVAKNVHALKFSDMLLIYQTVLFSDTILVRNFAGTELIFAIFSKTRRKNAKLSIIVFAPAPKGANFVKAGRLSHKISLQSSSRRTQQVIWRANRVISKMPMLVNYWVH